MAKHTQDKKTFNLPEVILGGQDGLVNVLGIILGLAAATSSNHIVLVAGLAATFAESISMAAVAYTSKIAEADYYKSEYEREQKEIEEMPLIKKREVFELYERYGFEEKELNLIVEKIVSNKGLWTDIIMENKLRLEPINRADVLPMAVIVGISAVVGSLVPILPFFFLPISEAVILSLGISAAALFFVGVYKAKKIAEQNILKQGLEMMVIGMTAAVVGYAIGTFFQSKLY